MASVGSRVAPLPLQIFQLHNGAQIDVGINSKLSAITLKRTARSRTCCSLLVRRTGSSAFNKLYRRWNRTFFFTTDALHAGSLVNATIPRIYIRLFLCYLNMLRAEDCITRLPI